MILFPQNITHDKLQKSLILRTNADFISYLVLLYIK
jgi:hypothetical protein